MYLLFAFPYLCTALHIPPLVTFSFMNSISVSVNSSNLMAVFSKAAYHVNPGADKKSAGPNSYISCIFLKFSNTSASNNVSV